MGQALFPTNPVEHFDQLFENFDQQDVAIYAHVHHSLMRYASDERLILNPGSVGEPFNGWWPLQHDTRAHYLILEVDDDGIAELDYRHVPYDVNRNMSWLLRQIFLTWNFISGRLRLAGSIRVIKSCLIR